MIGIYYGPLLRSWEQIEIFPLLTKRYRVNASRITLVSPAAIKTLQIGVVLTEQRRESCLTFFDGTGVASLVIFSGQVRYVRKVTLISIFFVDSSLWFFAWGVVTAWHLLLTVVASCISSPPYRAL